MGGDVADRVVLEDAAARNVAALRLLFAPCRDFHQHRKLLGLAYPGLQPLPCAFGVKVVGLGRGQNLHFLAHPVVAAALFEIGVQGREHIAQVGDVGHRVMHLVFGQRPARPVGKAVGLVRPMSGNALDQLVVGNGIAIAEHHGRDLGVEDRVRYDAGLMPDDFDILTGGVEDLQHFLVGHQRKERREVDAPGQRIDDDRFLRACHLHDAEQRVISRLPQKFGIDGDDRVPGEAGANSGEFRSGGNQIHEQSMTLLRTAFCRKR